MLLRDPLLWMLSTWGGWGVSELTVKSFPRSKHVGPGVQGLETYTESPDLNGPLWCHFWYEPLSSPPC